MVIGVDYDKWKSLVAGWRIIQPNLTFILGPETEGYAGYMSQQMHSNENGMLQVAAKRFIMVNRNQLSEIDRTEYFLYKMYEAEDGTINVLAGESPLWAAEFPGFKENA